MLFSCTAAVLVHLHFAWARGYEGSPVDPWVPPSLLSLPLSSSRSGQIPQIRWLPAYYLVLWQDALAGVTQEVSCKVQWGPSHPRCWKHSPSENQAGGRTEPKVEHSGSTDPRFSPGRTLGQVVLLPLPGSWLHELRPHTGVSTLPGHWWLSLRAPPPGWLLGCASHFFPSPHDARCFWALWCRMAQWVPPCKPASRCRGFCAAERVLCLGHCPARHLATGRGSPHARLHCAGPRGGCGAVCTAYSEPFAGIPSLRA